MRFSKTAGYLSSLAASATLLAALPRPASASIQGSSDGPEPDFGEGEAPSPTPPELLVPAKSFAPLQCNVDASILDSDDCLSSAIGLSSIVDEARAETLTVPCGTCVVVDYDDGSTVTVPGGLNVVGRLHFPPSASVVLRTTKVFVQGKWSMERPAPGNRVTLDVYGLDEEKVIHPHGDCCQEGDGFYEYDCNACTDPEPMGYKPFAVVGGQLDIRVFDESCSAWSKIKDVDVDDMMSITVDQDMAKCVRSGDEILITADSRDHDSHEIYEVDSVDETTGEITFVAPLRRVPPYEAGLEHPQLAIEAALLNRDVTFTSEEDPNWGHWIGGHLIVYMTPHVQQTIVGVRFENSGQEGVLGRYPIHFHVCGDTRSLVSKNVIYDSNQRCVFIHATNEVEVHDNVAFKTRGHCYATETGVEINNVFSYNLASYTKDLRRSNGQTDSAGCGLARCDASSFWFRNMHNTFIYNVAAGGTKRGFWIELEDKYQNQLHPDSFNNNTAHSYEVHGYNVYSHGWLPREPAYIKNFVSFFNHEGIKMHISGDITFQNALVADNFIGVRYGAWNRGTTFEDSLFMLSEPQRSRTLMYATFNNNVTRHTNAIFRNCVFRNWRDGARTIKFYWHNLMEFGMGDPVHLHGVTCENCDDGAFPKVQDCDVPEYDNLFMEIPDGTSGLSPADAPGFVVRDKDTVRAFLPEEDCVPLESSDPGCAVFCEGVCVRLVKVTPTSDVHDALDYESLELTHLDTGLSHEYSLNEYAWAWVVLPGGQYRGEFLDDNGDVMVDYRVQVEVWNEPQCADFVTVEDIVFPNSHTLTPTTAPTTAAPTTPPTIQPTRLFTKAYIEAGNDLKCPEGTRLFKKERVQSVPDCRDLCFDMPGCNFFTWGWSHGKTCMGCILDDASELDNHDGFNSYRLTSLKSPTDWSFELWNGLDGVNKKCPFGHSDRIGSVEDVTRRQCYQLCKDTPDCNYFSYGEFMAPSNDRDLCLLCQSADHLEDSDHFFTYHLDVPDTFPPTPAPTTSPPEPTIQPTRFFTKEYIVAAADRKCATGTRLFKKEGVQSVEDCRDICFDMPGCNFFTSKSTTCIGCMINDASELDDHNGFTAYELTSLKTPADWNFQLWNGLDGVDKKCPWRGSDRIGQAEDITRRQCYQLCKDTPDCSHFSYDEDDKDLCLLCKSADNLESSGDIFTYEMLV